MNFSSATFATILYSSCFDANAGLFETLLDQNDAIISDRLNHASIIDGVRLCKAQRFRYNHADMGHLETQLKRAEKCRFRIIATDGVFSMDGDVAPLDEICDLAERYDAMVMVDDSHATGFFGSRGRGSLDYKNVLGRVDIITSTFGKALGMVQMNQQRLFRSFPLGDRPADVVLHHLVHAIAVQRRQQLRHVGGVDVHRQIAKAVGDFLALDQQEFASPFVR